MTAASATDASALRHDLRTPLGHLIGYAQLLLEDGAVDRVADGRASLEGLVVDARAALAQVDRHFAATPARPGDDASLDGLAGALAPHQAAMASRVEGLIASAGGDADLLADLRRMAGSAHDLARMLRPREAMPGASGAGRDDADGEGLVLVVDDDVNNRDLLGRILVRDGHRPAFAADGARAIEIARTRRVNLVLLDVEMPGLGGHEVLRTLQADPELRAIPVLMVSAHDDVRSVARFIEEGAVDYLAKPYELVLLRARIAACLEMKRLRDRDRALQLARTRLLASISHDLRQPLQAMRLYGDALQRWCPDGEPADLLARQLVAGDAAVDMLDQFSDFSAIEEGALRSRFEPVELRGLCREVCERLRATQGVAPDMLQVRGARHWVSTDRTQFARIVQNLAGNAVRCVARGSQAARPRVRVTLRPLAGGLALDVVDNGPGIAPQRCAEIFRPYVQLESEAQAGGRGLGLAIVTGLARQLGLGLGAVVSVLGRGTRFRLLVPPELRLPDTPIADPASDESREARPVAADGAMPFAGRLFGVMDDDEASLRGLVSALESRGARCVGATAFARLAGGLDDELGLPDALVLDLDLNDEVDGIGAVVRLRERYEHPMPAVIVTGRVSLPTDLPDACVVLRKPAGLVQIEAALARLRGDHD